MISYEWNIIQGKPKQNELVMDKSIFCLNSSYGKWPKDLGNVILTSQVEEIGKHKLSVNRIVGFSSKPAAGSLEEPEIK